MGSKKSAPSATQINPAKEYEKILNLTKSNTLPFLNDLMSTNPQLTAMGNLANQSLANLPAWQKMLTSGFNTAMSGIPAATSALNTAWQNQVPTSKLTGPLLAAMPTAAGIAASGGALTPQLNRQATQDAWKYAGLQGMANTIPANEAGILNRDQLRSTRYNQSINELLGLTSGIGGLNTQGLGNALTYGGGLTSFGNLANQLSQGQVANQLGLLGGVAGQQGNVLGTGVDTLAKLIDPSASAVSSATNYNANAQQAAANAQSNKNSQTTSGVLGLAGSIAIAY
jgi:hypothetical protein